MSETKLANGMTQEMINGLVKECIDNEVSTGAFQMNATVTEFAKVNDLEGCEQEIEIAFKANGIQVDIGMRDEERTKLYYQVGITCHHAGFGMYQQANTNDAEPWESEDELLLQTTQAIYDEYGYVEICELGVDELPEGLEDIRGKVYNEKGRIFGYLRANTLIRGVAQEEDGYSAEYFAIVEK